MSIDINLLPWREEYQSKQKKMLVAHLCFSALISLFLVFLLHVWFARQIAVQDKVNDFFKREIASLDKALTQIQFYQKEAKKMIGEIEAIQQIKAQQRYLSALFYEIAYLVPEGVYLKSIVKVNDQLLLEGYAQSNKDLSLFMQQIQLSKIITRPTLSLVELANEQPASAKISFQLTCQIT